MGNLEYIGLKLTFTAFPILSITAIASPLCEATCSWGGQQQVTSCKFASRRGIWIREMARHDVQAHGQV